ncbi:uncharacterized protein LOC103985474 [Musa acuminata AAA Group]|uniref:uncharacterized protein LOC103985474 n=1 Tax=Musa acuminata AAA Group TaxID=214697 RepID=UPI0031DDE352
MPDRILSCFGGGESPSSTAAGPSLTTSIYETRLGLAALTWSRGVLGVTLCADLYLSDEDEEPLRFRVRPWLLWKRRGSRRFRLRDHPCHRFVEFAWDLSRASFRPSGAGGWPEPVDGFFFAVAVDGEMLLVSGDLAEEAYQKIRAQRPKYPFRNPAPAARRERVVLGDSCVRRSYRTMVRFGGRAREISIDLGAKGREREAGMAVAVDGESVLHVRRLRWKFRGSEKVETECGARMQVSWDLHDWLFHPKDNAASSGGAAPATAESEHAVFVFRFAEDPKPAEGHFGTAFGGRQEGHFGDSVYKGTVHGGNSGKTRNWSESSSSNGGSVAERMTRRRRRKSLLKTSSMSSSTSSASSASNSTVMEWASQEEVELQKPDGFSLLVYICKS